MSLKSGLRFFRAINKHRKRDELWPAIQGVRALAGLDLGELGGDGEALGLGERGDGRALRLQAKAGTALLLGADTVIGDEGRHWEAPLDMSAREPKARQERTPFSQLARSSKLIGRNGQGRQGRTSSGVAVSGDRFKNAAKGLQLNFQLGRSSFV